MNLRERLDTEPKGLVCYGCGGRFPWPNGWQSHEAHIDPELDDEGFLVEVHQRQFHSNECRKAWLAREGY